MSNSTMPNMPNFPGMSAVTDALEFMKNLWGTMGTPVPGFPGMVMPTLSVEEINKQITDLKAVESWLSMNMNMLRATIQALEVQSATISTLQSMGQTLSTAATPNAAAAAASAFPFSKPAEAASQETSKSDAETQADAKTEAKRKSRNDLKAEFKAESKPAMEGGSASASEPGTGNFSMPMANPTLWWNMLQEQFKQAVNTAVPSEASASSSAKPATGSPRKRKTPPKT
jgi:hypothetical protein